MTELNKISMKVAELNTVLKKDIDQRQKLMSKHKSDTLITATDFQTYGASEHVNYVTDLLCNVAKSQLKFTMSKQKATEVRDHLMVSLTYFNCLRALNVINISLEDVHKIKKHDEIEDTWVLTNEEYKVSMIYGAKIILLDEILQKQLLLFVKIFRPIITKDDHLNDMQRFLFTSSRFTTSKPLGVKMDHSAISNAMTATFWKAKVQFFPTWLITTK